MIGEHLETYTFEYLLSLGLSVVPDTVDKREGSIIYDAAATTAMQLSEGFKEIRQTYIDTFAQYSFGEPLYLRAAENGVNVKAPTRALRKAVFIGNNDLPYKIQIGARFGTVDGNRTINFTVTNEILVGTYELTAETVGSIGNEYIGAILPLGIANDLKSATMTDIIVPGEDQEPDEILRSRYFSEKNSKTFGGNLDQYRKWITELDGIAACQVYPIWKGGGTVKISFVDSTYTVASAEHIRKVQKEVDPTQDGQGLGIAPIDHIVTVTTPSVKTINISAVVQVAAGFTLEQLYPLISAEIEKYFVSARVDWGEPAGYDNNEYALTIFRSQISAAIVRVIGVLNVSELKLNGADIDIELRQDAQVQELPVLGVVSLA